jgi:hypothetical protein
VFGALLQLMTGGIGISWMNRLLPMGGNSRQGRISDYYEASASWLQRVMGQAKDAQDGMGLALAFGL